MKKTSIAIIILLIVLAIIIFFYINNTITGKTIEEDEYDSLKNYSYTKAICDKTKFCQDYEIKCQDKEVISVVALTGAVAQFSPDWEDPRSEDERDRLCG